MVPNALSVSAASRCESAVPRSRRRRRSLVPSGVAAGGECSDSCLAEADADGVLAAHRVGGFNESAVLEAWVAASIGTFVGSPTKVLPSVNPSFRLRESK